MASSISPELYGARMMEAREGVGVSDGMGIVVDFGARLRLGVAGTSGTLKLGGLGAVVLVDGLFGFVVEAFNAGLDFGFLMPSVLVSAISADRFLLFVLGTVVPLVSELGSEILEERRRDILRARF